MEKSDLTHSVYPLCQIFSYQSQFHVGRASLHQCHQKKCSIDWEGQNYLGLTLDWNYTKTTLISLCLDKSQPYFTYSSTNPRNVPKTHHINIINLFMPKTPNYPLRKAPLQNSTLNTQTEYNPPTARFYTMPDQ